MTRLKWKLVSVHFEIVLILTQDRWMVCVELTLGSESFRMHPMELLGDVGFVESHFSQFVDYVTIGAG